MGGDDFLDGGCQGSKNPCVYKKDADVLSGGAGYDIASYAPRADALTLSIGDGANDGDRAAGERDDVRADVEEVRGGSGNDVLTGDANANVLDGNGGNDTLLGMGGNDTLQGDAGNDVFDGGAGRRPRPGGGRSDVRRQADGRRRRHRPQGPEGHRQVGRRRCSSAAGSLAGSPPAARAHRYARAASSTAYRAARASSSVGAQVTGPWERMITACSAARLHGRHGVGHLLGAGRARTGSPGSAPPQ